MSRTRALTVHLDHLIRRQSFRYVPEEDTAVPLADQVRPRQEDIALRYDDTRRDDWFSQLRKPDFQRETNAWTPEDCVEFLDSVVNSRIIPSIILWRSPENNCIYVLDGSHHLSVIKAWMKDDWGDEAGDYYERRDPVLISEAADRVRTLVQQKIGLFQEFEDAYREQQVLVNQMKAPGKEMSPKRFAHVLWSSGSHPRHFACAVGEGRLQVC